MSGACITQRWQQSLTGGQSLDITWEATSVVSDVRLELWRTSDTAVPSFHFMGLITESTPNDGVFTWTVPNRGDDYYDVNYGDWKYPPQYRYKVRISDVSNDSTVFDFSDNPFHIDYDPNIESWILTNPDEAYGWDSDGDNRPDQLNFAWYKCWDVYWMNLYLEAEHDTDPSKNFTVDVDNLGDAHNSWPFDLSPDILEDPGFTYRFTIEDAEKPQAYDVYGPFKIQDPASHPAYGTVWWLVFQ